MTYGIDKIFPVFDEFQLSFMTVLVVCEPEHSSCSPQIQLTDSFSDGHLALGSQVQFLKNTI